MTSAGPQLIFVYGTLKRGCSNHAQLADQTYLGEARTAPGYRMYQLSGYPGLVPDPTATESVHGEIWSVTDAALQQLDAFEGVPEGLYRREPVRLLPPFDAQPVHTYIYAGSILGRTPLGPVWTE
ncbi:MAG: gamma-glutamylcyclotransferase [Opitutus sp.]|nr:gamma-glutamylcyclotransferase [Opitutus sp.]